MTRAEIITYTNAHIISGGGQTLAFHHRAIEIELATSYMHKTDDKNVIGGYTPVEAVISSGRIPYFNSTGYRGSVLKQDSTGILLDDNKFISGSDGLVQVDFGSAATRYFWASTNGANNDQSFIYLDPTYCQFGFNANYIQMEDSNGINHFADTGFAHKFSVGGSQISQFDIDGLYLGYLTPQRVPVINNMGYVISSDVTQTELTYLEGVTSSIQTQINNLSSGLSWKESVRVATNANVDITSAPANIDGVVMANDDRVLLFDNFDGTENGLYIYNGAGNPMTRGADTDTGAKILGMVVAIEEGTYADKGYICTTDGPIVVGVSIIDFGLFGGTTYTGTTNRISISGNTIDISSAYTGQNTITTLGTITTGTWTTSTVVTAQNFVAQGTAGNGFIQLNTQSANVTAGAANSVRVWSRSGQFAYTQENDGFYRMFTSTVGGNRIYTLQDNDGTLAFLSDIPIWSSGNYTPTRSAEVNTDSNVTMFPSQFLRLDYAVTVSGRFQINPTTTSTLTSFEITLPVTSNFVDAENLAGVAVSGAGVSMSAEIIAVPGTSRAKIFFISSLTTDEIWSFHFTYRVIP